MRKRNSKHLRYNLYNVTNYVCHWNKSFGMYSAKKQAEDKHYNDSLSHAEEKLVRVIYAMEKPGLIYLPTL